MTAAAQLDRVTPYDMIGGVSVIREVVDRFYDLLETDSTYAELRALHATDLTPMRPSLSGFLAAWMGGPRDWFEERPGRCMMSAHREISISPGVAQQWADAMTAAIASSPVDPGFGAKLARALSDLALRMIIHES
jgi:hemoglobin